MSHANLELLLSQLEKVKKNGPNSWLACCPAHQDKDPSLAIGLADSGKVLLKCFCGCTTKEIMDSVGLPLSVLFHPDSRKYQDTGVDIRKRIKEKQIMAAVARDAMVLAMLLAKVRNKEEVTSKDVETAIDISNRLAKVSEEYLV